jgi:hypothetical protein
LVGKHYFSIEWCERVGPVIVNALMTTESCLRVDVDCLMVRTRLADVTIRYGSYFGTVPVAVRCALAGPAA